MKVCGIIAEYNPFHNGHKYHLEQTKNQTGALTAVIMSGSLTQRGEFAAFSKHVRAKAALLNGADLVLELPCIYSCASAQQFAEGAVKILDRLGAVDYLSFGSECGDIQRLSEASRIISRLESSGGLTGYLKSGMSYPRAKHAAVKSVSESCARLTGNPNDTLGIEYLSALKKIKSQIQPVAVKREWTNHDGGEANGIYASASFIREQIGFGGQTEIFIPENTRAIYGEELALKRYKIDPQKLGIAAMYALKRLDPAEFALLPDVCEGLENRLYEAAVKSHALDEFLTRVKTKRYTLARLRRIVIYALMGMTADDLKIEPSYVRVLAMNENGKKILAKAKKTSRLEIHTAFSKIDRSGGRAAKLDRRSTDLHNYLSYAPQNGGRDFYDNAVIL